MTRQAFIPPPCCSPCAASCAALPAAGRRGNARRARPRPTVCPKIAAKAKVRQVLVVRSRPSRRAPRRASSASEPARPSFGQMIGLHEAADSLDLKSSVALVLDQDTDEVLFSKNSAGGPADRLADQADDRAGRHRGAAAARRDDHDHRRGRRHREGQPLAPARRHPAAPRGDAAPGADGVGEPRRQRARPQLSGRPGRLRRGDEPQGARRSA